MLKYKIFITINNTNKFFYLNTCFESDIKNLLASIVAISIYKNIDKIDCNFFYSNKIPIGRGDISEIKLLKKKFYLIDQSYNSNPLSLNSALKNFNMIKLNDTKKHLILGDMLELGKHSKKLHKEVAKNINKTSIKNVNVIGKHMSEAYKILHNNKKGIVLKNHSEIINLIKNNINNNDYLMIKGSNSTGLNKLTNDIKLGKINAL
jgi:murE/murF fusion protein